MFFGRFIFGSLTYLEGFDGQLFWIFNIFSMLVTYQINLQFFDEQKLLRYNSIFLFLLLLLIPLVAHQKAKRITAYTVEVRRTSRTGTNFCVKFISLEKRKDTIRADYGPSSTRAL